MDLGLLSVTLSSLKKALWSHCVRLSLEGLDQLPSGCSVCCVLSSFMVLEAVQWDKLVWLYKTLRNHRVAEVGGILEVNQSRLQAEAARSGCPGLWPVINVTNDGDSVTFWDTVSVFEHSQCKRVSSCA